MKKLYHLLVTSYELRVKLPRFCFAKSPLQNLKGINYHHIITSSHHLIISSILLFCFLPFFAFAQTPEPGCNCIQIGTRCWATCNVATPGDFAESPTDTGWYYQWGVNVGWRPYPNTPLLNSDNGTTWNSSPTSPPSPAQWTNTPCPDGWELPTQSELAELATYAILSGSFGILNGVNGHFFDSGDPNQPLLFLPCTGSRFNMNGNLSYANDYGYYWSRTPNSANAFFLHLTSTNALSSSTGSQPKGYGYALRCVAIL